jgi:hypothetical protein
MATSKSVLRLFKQAQEIITRVDNGSRREPDVRRQFQEILDDDQPLVGVRPDQLYASPFGQYKALKRWNDQLQLGFTKNELEATYQSMPGLDHRHGSFTPTTLCWNLADVDTTVKSKLEIANLVYGDPHDDPYLYEGRRVAVSDRVRQSRFKLVDGSAPFIPKRIWWETHQINTGTELKPSQVVPAKAAGTQVLDITIQHRVYVGLQDGRRIPYLDTPGLLVDVPYRGSFSPPAWGPWHFVLFLKGGLEHGGWDDTQLHIGVTACDRQVFTQSAEPVIVS